MNQAIKVALSVILALFGAFFGWGVAQGTQEFYGILEPRARLLTVVAFICLGTLLGLVVAPLVARLLLGLIQRATQHLETLSLQEILLGAVGLIFGLIIAFFSSLLMSNLPIARIPLVGEYLAPLIIVLVTLFWAILGAFFGTRMAVVHSLATVFTSAGSRSLVSAREARLVDTSAIIDGRIADICKAGFISGNLMVPRFVLEELQQVADSADPLKRGRGRRGLGVLHALQQEHGLTVIDDEVAEIHAVDSKLVRLAQDMKADLITTDYNLNRVASLQGVKVLNINELANAVKAVFLPGEELSVQVVKEGREPNQGVGYLEDGTMIVVEDGRRHVGTTVHVEVTRALQTVAGKMIFARLRSAQDSRRTS